MIEMSGVSKVYPNRVVALHDINLRVEKGEFVFLVGPSGAGKSTMIRLLYREEVPTAGEIVVAGYRLRTMRRNQVPLLRRRVGVVFQDFRLLPDRTVFDNVAFALVVTEASRREIQRKVPAVLEMVGLRHRARDYPRQLSGGEQQRVALARAMVNSPPILIADEPTGNLDPATAWGLMELLQEINQSGTTILMATHAENIVNAMNKRVVQLAHGTIVRDEVAGRYSLEG
ncbi:MAG: cell division ATP-binding protein FtsE [Clostridia bacterium]|nr:cell division ATP-binding protein FtsE [Clostridia bacterium]MCL6521622.1 cell division ATP-binding protein FtsE [Bacillota bacterium]